MDGDLLTCSTSRSSVPRGRRRRIYFSVIPHRRRRRHGWYPRRHWLVSGLNSYHHHRTQALPWLQPSNTHHSCNTFRDTPKSLISTGLRQPGIQITSYPTTDREYPTPRRRNAASHTLYTILLSGGPGSYPTAITPSPNLCKRFANRVGVVCGLACDGLSPVGR